MGQAVGKRAHWIVQLNHGVRSGVFALVFVVMSAHMVHEDHPPWLWTLLVAQFLVYPHVVYVTGRLARDPARAEMRALVLDPFLMGLWLAFLEFPLWITYSVAIGTMISIAVYRAVRGVAEATIALVAGATLMIAVRGLHFSPETGWPATLLSMATLTAYLLLVAFGAYSRAIKLHAARTQLQENERSLTRQLGEIHALQAQVSDLANRDPLTGLFNRRYLDSTMDRELERCRREAQPLALVLIDIDHFKRINDTSGHPAGDAVLLHVARLLEANARASDVVCRYGGEEFVLLLPGMGLATATQRAQSCRMALESTVVTFEGLELKATLSIGTAAFPEHGASRQELIRQADRALYLAKSQGRNRVVVSVATGVGSPPAEPATAPR